MRITLRHRVVTLYLLIIACYAVILVRCMYLQVMCHAWFVQRAQAQVQSLVIQPVTRGVIYDRRGHVLAATQFLPSAYLVPRTLTAQQHQVCSTALQQYVPERVASFEKARNRSFWYIARHLSPADQQAIDELFTPHVAYLAEPHRVIHSLGTRDIIGACDPDTHGISGLELIYDTLLSGSPATLLVHKDGRRQANTFKTLCIDPGKPSQDLHTTLDLEVISYAQEELIKTVHTLGSSAGAVVVMDPHTGDIICAAQHQHYEDGSCFDAPSDHVAITQSFELGSVMKTFFALAAYQTQQVTDDELIDCHGLTQSSVHGYPVSTWKAHGLLSFFDVVRYSNNIGTAQIARRIGPQLFATYELCGFGTKTHIDWPGEVSGFINPPSRWSGQSLNSLSFGYEIQATLLQLACAYSLLYTGSQVRPRLQRQRPISTKPVAVDARARQATLAILQAIAQPHHIHWQRPDIQLYGKTGTARMLDDTGHYSRFKHLYTFAGIVQHHEYARVIVTCIKHAQRHDLYASNVTLPLFMKIAWHLVVQDGR